MKKLLVVDGNSILNRAYYGVRMLTNADGLPTNALFGIVNILSRQLDAVSPDYLAVAFDLKAPTFRHKMYDAYKAGRKPMPEELALQLPYAKKLCLAMGFTVIEKEGYEADDILGTLAGLAHEKKDTEAYILTGDRDSLQLITEDGRVKVLLAGNNETTVMDEAKFKEKYGVSSTVFVDVKALMGDSSDNIPGVPGIGEKTALKLISEQGSLDGVYASVESAGHSASLKAKLITGKESAYLSKELATIKCDVPLDITLEELANQGFDRKALAGLFKTFSFSTLLKKFGLENEKSEDSEPAEFERIEAGENYVDLIEGNTVALHFSGDGFILFDGKKNIAPQLEIKEIKRLFEAQSLRIVCADCKTLYKEFEELGIHYRGAYHDIMLSAYVLNAVSSGFDLSHLALEYLGISSIPLGLEAQIIFEIYEKLDKRIAEQGASKLLYDIEMPLAAVLADMEITGFRTDTEGLKKYGEALDAIAGDLENRIHFTAGCDFNVNSPSQLGEVLFERLGLPAQKKTKSGSYSTNAEILEKLRPYHPIIDDILEYRKVAKLKSTYVDGLLKLADEDGRIHSCFNQTVTATGRISSSEPNLQNIPIKTELGRELRKFFVPAEDRVLVDADYSQIELRVLAAISGDEAMISAFKSGADIHASTAARIFGVHPDSVTLEMRKKAKAINFGIVYGMGEFSLSEDLGISRAQAKKYIESYLSGYPMVCSYLDDIVKKAYEDGYVSTIFGRRRYIPELAGQNKNLKHFGERVAKNSPIQGSAADIIKIAMIETAKKLKESGIDAHLILQVHDELIIEAHKDCAEKAARILEEAMENAITLEVPLIAEACMGKTWLDCK